MDEIWKFIKETNDYYMISSHGRVLSFKRNRVLMLKPTPTYKGYLTIELYGNFTGKQFYIHRLVGEHFLENPHNLEQINHKDLNKENNCVTNLEWCSLEDNIYHSHDQRTKKR